MPGDQQLHLRLSEDQHKRYKEAAKLKKMSLTAFALMLLDAASDKVLAGTSIAMPAQPAQNVQAKPSRVQVVQDLVQPELPERPDDFQSWDPDRKRSWIMTEEN